MALITVENLCLGYDGRAVVNGLSFQVEEGSYVCVVGENGSGKTTLMRTLLGLQQPLSGTITFDSSVASGEIGYLPQQSFIQREFPATVREIVLSGCIGKLGKRFFYSSREKQTAEDCMRRAEIEHLAERSYKELSGGQQQRVLMARALCAAGRVLVLDEPTAGLDPVFTEELYGLIEKLNKEGMTIIMVSHDLEAAMKYATHILHIGDALFYGSRDEYLERSDGRFLLLQKESGVCL